VANSWSGRQSFGVGIFSIAIGRNWRLEIRAGNTLTNGIEEIRHSFNFLDTISYDL